MGKRISFHWLLNYGLSAQDKITLVKQLESRGYDSILFAFNQDNTDPFINASFLYPYAPGLDYMMAIRTYALSPTYCAMQCRAFYEFSGKQAILNLINGTVDDDQLLFSDDKTTINERQIATNKFAESVKQRSNAIIGFSGKSNQTILNVIEHGDISFNLMSDLTPDIVDTLKTSNKKIFGRVFVQIIDTVTDIEKLNSEYAEKTFGNNLKDIFLDRYHRNAIYGTVQDIGNRIIDLYNLGIDNILISALNQEDIDEIVKTHDIIDYVRDMGY